jgi:hypothetical protein
MHDHALMRPPFTWRGEGVHSKPLLYKVHHLVHAYGLVPATGQSIFVGLSLDVEVFGYCCHAFLACIPSLIDVTMLMSRKRYLLSVSYENLKICKHVLHAF